MLLKKILHKQKWSNKGANPTKANKGTRWWLSESNTIIGGQNDI